MEIVRAQPGPQESFLASPADIVVYGGAAGGGKSFALLLEPLRHINNKQFGGVIFRRSTPQLTGAGSLWEDAGSLYPMLGAQMREHPYLEVKFPSGATLQFTHLQHVRDVLTHHGKQYAFIGFDELTHFESFQFWYLISRMRSTSSIVPYMRCTTNPDPDSFVRKIIAWWIGSPDCVSCQDGTCRTASHGEPNLDRNGKIRWFVRRNDELHWSDDRDELIKQWGERCEPLSLTFIAANLEDNPALMNADPGYRARLEVLPEIERARLLGGNWNVRPMGGHYIKAEWFERRWTELPRGLNIYMSSDFAVTEPQNPDDDPDYTEHGVFGVDENDDLYIIDWWYGQTTSNVWIDSLIDLWAKHKPLCWFGEGGLIRRAIEPALTKRLRERQVYCRMEWINPTGQRHGMSSSLEGYSDRSKQAKAIRGRAFQARAASGKIVLPANAPWLSHVIETITKFPAKGHDDSFDVVGQMCLAIDETRPGVAPIVTDSEKRRERWQNTRRQSNWRTA